MVDITNNPVTNEILQENHYSPFGLELQYAWMNDAALDTRYRYNGKEAQEDFGLGMIDYEARFYDPAIARWGGVDALGEDPNQIDKSPYAYAWNNPIRYDDPDGNCPNCAAAGLGAVVGGFLGGASNSAGSLLPTGKCQIGVPCEGMPCRVRSLVVLRDLRAVLRFS